MDSDHVSVRLILTPGAGVVAHGGRVRHLGLRPPLDSLPASDQRDLETLAPVGGLPSFRGPRSGAGLRVSLVPSHLAHRACPTRYRPHRLQRRRTPRPPARIRARSPSSESSQEPARRSGARFPGSCARISAGRNGEVNAVPGLFHQQKPSGTVHEAKSNAQHPHRTVPQALQWHRVPLLAASPSPSAHRRDRRGTRRPSQLSPRRRRAPTAGPPQPGSPRRSALWHPKDVRFRLRSWGPAPTTRNRFPSPDQQRPGPPSGTSVRRLGRSPVC